MLVSVSFSCTDLRVSREEVREDPNEYIEMAPTNGPLRGGGTTVTPASLPAPRPATAAQQEPYMDMSPSKEATFPPDSAYMDMSQGAWRHRVGVS